MPSTDDDADLIASMPTGTHVRHIVTGQNGEVTHHDVQFDQIPVVFSDGSFYFCYPANLQVINPPKGKS